MQILPLAAATESPMDSRATTVTGMGKQLLLWIMHKEPGDSMALICGMPILQSSLEASSKLEQLRQSGTISVD